MKMTAQPTPALPPRAQVLGCAIDRLDMEQTLDLCARAVEERSFTQHMAINAAKLVSMEKDTELRSIVAGCELVSADGQAVVWASRLLGDPLPERVAGIDLMHRLLALAEDRGYRPYILGAKREVLETAVAKIKTEHPRLQLAGWRDGYFAESDSGAVADAIRASGADLLFVAMSSPRKEYFLGDYGRRMDVPFVMGVGGSIDVVAGFTRRAPVLWQRLGLEWLYRLCQEPRRMFKRYAVTNGRFIRLLAMGMIRRRSRMRN